MAVRYYRGKCWHPGRAGSPIERARAWSWRFPSWGTLRIWLWRKIIIRRSIAGGWGCWVRRHRARGLWIWWRCSAGQTGTLCGICPCRDPGSGCRHIAASCWKPETSLPWIRTSSRTPRGSCGSPYQQSPPPSRRDPGSPGCWVVWICPAWWGATGSRSLLAGCRSAASLISQVYWVHRAAVRKLPHNIGPRGTEFKRDVCPQIHPAPRLRSICLSPGRPHAISWRTPAVWRRCDPLLYYIILQVASNSVSQESRKIRCLSFSYDTPCQKASLHWGQINSHNKLRGQFIDAITN